MSESVSEELQRKVAERVWGKCSDWLNGIVMQVAPDGGGSDNDETAIPGEVLYGRAVRPFMSICEIAPEQFVEGQGWNDRDLVVHTVTCVIYAAKDTVERHPALWRKVRETAIRSIHKYRFTLSQEGSCVWYANARPQSFLNGAAWARQTRFVSAFDLLFRTQEPRLHT